MIFHLAAGNGHQASMEFPLADFEDGVAALLGLLEAAAEAAPEARIVFTSTRQLYGRLGRPGVTEAHPLAPPDVHSVHKEAGEHLLRRFAARRAAGFAVLRLTNTYGPGQPLRGPGAGFVGNFLRSALAGEAITVLGRGDLVRDLNHVEDVVDALIRAGSPGSPSGTWNLGAPPITLRAFAEAVFRTLGKPPRIREVPLPPDLAAIAVGDIHGDWSRASRDLGWEPRIPLETGLAETIRALSP